MTSTAVIAFTSIGFLSLAAAMPARADGPADRGAQDTSAIPDFSGIWAHLRVDHTLLRCMIFSGRESGVGHKGPRRHVRSDGSFSRKQPSPV
jgi:hypothetical protein